MAPLGSGLAPWIGHDAGVEPEDASAVASAGVDTTMGGHPEISYRFALRPKWIIWHVIAVSAVVTMVFLGLWQVRRLQERRADNAIILARGSVDPMPVAEVLAPDTLPTKVEALTFRRVVAVGEYRVADEVLVRNRTNGGAPGYWVLTPLQQASGVALVVNRGWIPLPYGDANDPALFAPPSGTVTVTGAIHETQKQEGLGVEDPTDGRLAKLSRVDVPRLGQQVAYPVLPAYIDLVGSDPPSLLAQPQPIPPRELNDGSHVNYAGQWFIFTTLTLITYPLLLRRTARRLAT